MQRSMDSLAEGLTQNPTTELPPSSLGGVRPALGRRWSQAPAVLMTVTDTAHVPGHQDSSSTEDHGPHRSSQDSADNGGRKQIAGGKVPELNLSVPFKVPLSVRTAAHNPPPLNPKFKRKNRLALGWDGRKGAWGTEATGHGGSRHLASEHTAWNDVLTALNGVTLSCDSRDTNHALRKGLPDTQKFLQSWLLVVVAVP